MDSPRLLTQDSCTGPSGKRYLCAIFSESERVAVCDMKFYLKATSDVTNHKGHLVVAFGGKQKDSPVTKKTIAGWLVGFSY